MYRAHAAHVAHVMKTSGISVKYHMPGVLSAVRLLCLGFAMCFEGVTRCATARVGCKTDGLSRAVAELGCDDAVDGSAARGGYGPSGNPANYGGEYGGTGSVGGYGAPPSTDARSSQNSPVVPQSQTSGATQETPDPCTACVSMYEQCGGGDLPSAVCCTGELACTKKNEFYAQCLPADRIRRNVANQAWDGSEVACGTDGGMLSGDTSRVRSPRD